MKHGVQLALAALFAAGVGGDLRAADPEPLQPGDQARGEISSAAPLNHSDGTRSRLYTVEIGERELVRFDVSGPLRAQLSLFDSDELVARSDGSSPASLALRAPRSAAYTLAVSSAEPEAFGPYTLRSQVVDGWDGSPLRAGAQILDWADGRRELPLRVDRRAMYTIDLRSGQFDALLRIAGNGIDVQDDDGGEGTNARLSVLLDPGTYTLTVGGWGGSGRGLYELAVDSRPVPAGLNQGGGIRADGSTLQGALQGTPLRYQFTLRERQMVTADMRSGDFDALLVLRGEGVEHRDDDGGEGLDARLVQVLEPGDYTIEATSATGGSGLFTLTVTTAGVPEGTGGGTLTVGSPKEALLLPGAADRYAFSVAEAGDYVMHMASLDFDSWLELFDAEGRPLASDDDSGGGLNARIRIALEPGDYTLEASAIAGDGGYQVSVSGP